MTTRDRAPQGSPCWADLWTSDVDGSRRFYSDVLAWEAQAPNPEFGGYFMFTHAGQPVAGGMGATGDQPANDLWQVYFATRDLAKALKVAEDHGATIVSEAMPVADLGVQAILVDPGGAHLGLWQPGTFQGFTVLGEPGTPSWFELHTRDHAGAVAFYRAVLGVATDDAPGPGGLAYTTLRDPAGGEAFAGIIDATSFVPEGAPAHWSVYWEVADMDRAVASVRALGGSVVTAPETTPYGQLATVRDPCGALFRLHAGAPVASG